MQNCHSLEIPTTFECAGQSLTGMIHQSEKPAKTGALVIVGGPQYRVGSHRQFILLARHLAAHGLPTMRFDFRGMGDSEGDPRSFTEIDQDIRAATNCFFSTCRTLERIVLWGLCDGASAASFYGYRDDRVQGLVLLNPWVYTEQGAAKTYLKNYYLQRLLNREFWAKLLSLDLDLKHSISAFAQMIKQASGKASHQNAGAAAVDENTALPIRMRECLKKFQYPILLILSGRDLTADEFKETVQSDPDWQILLGKPTVTRYELSGADHTFSSADWRNQVNSITLEWLITLA